MFIADLFESYVSESATQLVVLYPGRFQPFHLGHKEVFQALQAKFGRDHVWIATSNKTEPPRSPFNFSDKTILMHAAGIPSDRIIESTNPYKLPDRFDPANTIFLVAVGAPDRDRLRPDTFKKDGNPTYFKTFTKIEECVSASKHGYVVIANERKKIIEIGKKQFDVSHGTTVREVWNQIRDNPKERQSFILQLYGRDDPEIGRVLDKIQSAEQVTEDIPPPENARKTQIAGTLGTYKKASDIFKQHNVQGKALDFGAGLGKGTAELGSDAESYEPFPNQDFKPHYIDVTKIPDNSYKRIVNLNVLNVVPNTEKHRIRDEIVRNIGRVLAPGGVAIITTRGRDVLTIKGTPGEEPMSMISSIGTYQKGFTQVELREYISSVLGDGFEVKSVKLGPAGVMIKKNESQQGVAEGRENYNGVNILFQKDDDEIFVKASAGGRELGHVLFVIDGDYLMPQDLEVEERFRGQGIAQTMYDYVKSKGYKIRRSGQQTDAGAGFWDKHKGQGQNVWEQGVAEDAAGVGVVKNSKDPRYSMATMGDQNDVDGDTLGKEMAAFYLVGRKPPKTKQKQVKKNIGKGVKESFIKRYKSITEELRDIKIKLGKN
ncbi:Cytidyltransferase-like domain containing protein [uncultured Caudovirales phage]|uniref:Cytidyltransferase-like domain containing protein n=1 Tax=uncultured Caudovirales phage TaxID=2100421 RepID=A0A6J5LHE8_9CAUD|nr:Cytidyltransferase-like domain containing protein [uncultured Caudovirales phage]